MALSTLADGLCQKVAAVEKIRSDRIIFRGDIICYNSWVPCPFQICKSLSFHAPTECSTKFCICINQPVRESDCEKKH